MGSFRGLARAGMFALALAIAPWLAAETLRYATVGEPPSLDQHVVTSDLATTIAHHMFEGLYTFDANYEPQPLLASGETVSADGKTITIQLRRGVKFHDGQPLTSADVVASLNRWGEHGSRGKLLFANVAAVSAAGSHAVTPDVQYAVRAVEEPAGVHQRWAGDLSGAYRRGSGPGADRGGGLCRHRPLPVR